MRGQMSVKHIAAKALQGLRVGLASIALFQFTIGASLAGAAPKQGSSDANTATPIKHVIIIIGENRTFDHIFATYQPKPGETVNNLLSEGIITAKGAPGVNFALANQFSAVSSGATFELSPMTSKALYPVLPAPLNGGPTNVCTDNGICNLGDATSSEDGLSKHPINYSAFL